DCVSDFRGIDSTLAVHRQEGDVEAFALLQMFACVKHRVVLGRAGDYVSAAGRALPGEPEDGEIVRLGAAAGEDDFVRLCAEQGSDGVARIIDGGSRLTSRGVNARFIPRKLLEGQIGK